MKTFLVLKRCAAIASFMIMLTGIMTAQNIQSDQFEYRDNMRINKKNNTTAAMYNINSHVYPGIPEEAARQFLHENKTTFGLTNITDLKFIETIVSPAGKHVGFLQTHSGIPVYGSETVVSLNKENRVSMVVNGVIPIIALKSTVASFSKNDAIKNAISEVKAEEVTLVTQPKAELYIYQDSLSKFNLTWKINFVANKPSGDWQIFVDANSGVVLKVMDISIRYVNGQGKVFRPDPITSLQNTSLTDQNNSDYSALQSAYTTVTLSNLNDAVGGVYRLQGRYAKSENIEIPNTATVTNTTSSFLYNRSQAGFEETNTYYFIDAERQYIGGLGFAPQWNGYDYIRFDPHGLDGADNSHYVPSSQYIAYGDGGVDDAEDQDVVLHEYAHAIHDALMVGTGIGGTEEGRVSEGSGDYLAVSYRRTLSTFQPNKVFPWDGNGESWDGRLLNSTSIYPNQWTGLHDPAGVLWASTMMDIETSSGVGRDVSSTLLLASFSYVSGSSTVLDQVNAIFQADRDIYNGSHLSTLATVFYNRGFFYGNEVSGTITSNTTWSGNKYVTGNVTVNSGVTLTISQNTFLFFASGTSLTVNGTLTANGSSTDKITFDFISPNYTTQNGIKINSGATINVSHAIIKNAWYGIYCNNTSSSPISNCEIMYCNTGIYFSSTNLGISNNYIHNNSMGIALYNSSPTLTLNRISGNTNYGVSSSGSTSIPLYGSGSTQGKNKISGNSVGVCAFSYSLPMLGNNSPTNGGYNTLGENTSYNIYAITSGVMYAINNYWGTIPPTASKIWINNGVILYSPYLYSDPTGLMKSVPVNDDAVLAMLQNAMNLIEQKNFITARDICLDIINNYPDSYAAFNALSLLSQDWNPNGKQANKDMLRTLFDKDKQKLNAAAGLMLAEFDKVNKLKVIEEVIGKFTGDAILEDALFSKFLYYNNDVKDKENARLVSVELDKLFPNSLTAFDAHSQLGDKDYLQKTYPFAKNGKEQKTNISVIPDRYELATNYPNPFNPTTTIDYQLLKDGLVTLKIYDILGNEVKTLVNENKEMGRYTVQFDASSLASGMYVYQLRVNDYTSTKKMLLLK